MSRCAQHAPIWCATPQAHKVPPFEMLSRQVWQRYFSYYYRACGWDRIGFSIPLFEYQYWPRARLLEFRWYLTRFRSARRKLIRFIPLSMHCLATPGHRRAKLLSIIIYLIFFFEKSDGFIFWIIFIRTIGVSFRFFCLCASKAHHDVPFSFQ